MLVGDGVGSAIDRLHERHAVVALADHAAVETALLRRVQRRATLGPWRSIAVLLGSQAVRQALGNLAVNRERQIFARQLGVGAARFPLPIIAEESRGRVRVDQELRIGAVLGRDAELALVGGAEAAA